jgi:hypothetical protein
MRKMECKDLHSQSTIVIDYHILSKIRKTLSRCNVFKKNGSRTGDEKLSEVKLSIERDEIQHFKMIAI